jgi:hypothetical protein
MRTHRQSRVESSRVESSTVEYSRVQSNSQRRGRDNLDYALRPRAIMHRHSPVESSPVQPSPIRLAKMRHLPYLQWLRAGIRAHRQRQVESHESCRVDSIGATCFIFVSRITGIGCYGCYFAFGNGRRKVILLVQVHQAICDASHCDQRKRPTTTDGITAQCSFQKP